MTIIIHQEPALIQRNQITNTLNLDDQFSTLSRREVFIFNFFSSAVTKVMFPCTYSVAIFSQNQFYIQIHSFARADKIRSCINVTSAFRYILGTHNILQLPWKVDSSLHYMHLGFQQSTRTHKRQRLRYFFEKYNDRNQQFWQYGPPERS